MPMFFFNLYLYLLFMHYISSFTSVKLLFKNPLKWLKIHFWGGSAFRTFKFITKKTYFSITKDRTFFVWRRAGKFWRIYSSRVFGIKGRSSIVNNLEFLWRSVVVRYGCNYTNVGRYD